MPVNKVILENNTADLIRIPVLSQHKQVLGLSEDYFELSPKTKTDLGRVGGRKLLPETVLDELREAFPQIHTWIARNRLLVK